MRYLIIIPLILFLISCKNEISEIEKLRKENELLKIKLQQQSNLSFWPIVIEKEKIVKIGEEYIADVRLATIDKDNPPIIILGTYNENLFIPSGDTLTYDAEYGVSTYRIFPKDTGEHIWNGKIIYFQNGVLKDFIFEGKYYVIN